MARNRVIYQSDIVFVGSTGATGSTNRGDHGAIEQLHRVQSANYSFDVARTDVNQFGQLAAVDRIILEQPTVTLDLNYLVLTGENESRIGLDVGTGDSESALTQILSGDDAGSGQQFVKNYYIATSPEGSDAGITGATSSITGTNASVIGIGNGFLSSFTVNGAVGDFVNADVSVEGLNMTFDQASMNDGINNPAVNPEDGAGVGTGSNGAGDLISIEELDDNSRSIGTGAGIPAALRPGNVGLVTSGVVGFDSGDLKYQNFTIGFDLSRENLEQLGSRFAFAKEIEFPAAATMDFSALIGDMSATADGGGTGTNDESLEKIVRGTDSSFNCSIDCNGQSDESGLLFTLKGAKLISQSVSSSIGDNKSVDLSFESQIGGPADTDNGISINRS